MKTKIHPKYYEEATITCSCGNVFTVGSTVKKMEVEICSNCHPFYTGKKKLVDTAGRVDKFEERMEAAKKFKAAKSTKKSKKSQKTPSNQQQKKISKKEKTNKKINDPQ